MGFDISDDGSASESHTAATGYAQAPFAPRVPDRVRAGHRDYQWEKLSSQYKAHCRTLNALCHLCVARGDAEHGEIDYHAKALSPLAFETDHIKPWKHYPELRYVWANLAPSHSRCNRQRRDALLNPDEPQPIWVKPDW